MFHYLLPSLGRYCGTHWNTRWYTGSLPEPIFPFIPFVSSSLFSLWLCPFCLLLGTLEGYLGDDIGMDTAVVDTAVRVRKGQTKQQCS